MNSTTRTFSTASQLYQQQQRQEDIRDPPRSDEPPRPQETDANPTSEKASGEQSQTEGEKKEGESAEGEPKSDEKKGAPPPPPPHGDKTPWQVFTETLKSEFQASKEWNEGTKQLKGSVHDFTQNPNVQKARSAYSKAAGAATSTTGAA
ncbi:hypothetical protein LTR28_006063, partial [Elasticomyces elasticus]